MVIMHIHNTVFFHLDKMCIIAYNKDVIYLLPFMEIDRGITEHIARTGDFVKRHGRVTKRSDRHSRGNGPQEPKYYNNGLPVLQDQDCKPI